MQKGSIEAFVSGVGTGGTLIGCGKRLKEVFLKIKIVAVEPSESPVMSGGKHGSHRIQGIGDGFVSAIVSDACMQHAPILCNHLDTPDNQLSH